MLIYYMLVLISHLVYLYCFFPVSLNLQKDAILPPQTLFDVKFNVSELYKPKVDTLVFIVIDALRTDFINHENMPHLVSAANDKGCFLNVEVESPTVTLPRIKSITTGVVSQFVDIILNLASTETITDSFLHQADIKNKKIIFYGDETWLKLYPNMFLRSEGTSSFFVHDFTEVDINVTRHLEEELTNNDWDIMFLHYLGLDHIGHVYGPYSNLIPGKLSEMDSVFHKITTAMQHRSENVLYIVTGDHGMKDSGGHGGATFSEINVPFVVHGIKCYNDTVAQTDIAPTLSVLMGLNIPTCSIGKLIRNLLSSLTVEQQLYAFLYNSLILNSTDSRYSNIFENAQILHYNYLRKGSMNYSEALNQYQVFISKTSEYLVKSSVVQNLNLLILSSILSFLSFLYVLIRGLSQDASNLFSTDKTQFLIALTLLSMYFAPTVAYFIIILLALNFVILLHKNINKNWQLKTCNDNTILLITGSVIHILTFLSSSFIEEEHQTWYFLIGTFILYNLFNFQNWIMFISFTSAFVGLRFLRMINQTGDKWASVPDLADWFMKDEHHLYLNVFFIANLALCMYCHSLIVKHKKIWLLNLLIYALVFIFKFMYFNSIFLGKLIWLLIFLNLVASIMYNISFLNTWILISCLLLQPCNVILLPACIAASMVFCKYIHNPETLALVHIWLGNTLYFCQGHSNSLSSVNVASGYIGLDTYVPSLVISQILCYTYSLPVLAHFLVLEKYKLNTTKVWSTIIVFRLPNLIVMCILTLVQRDHLFVWSVFAPKLLIESVHSFLLLLEYFLYTAFTESAKLFNKKN